jgi:hypothetical protein
MKRLIFIGAIALAACFAFSSCSNKITKEDVAKLNKLIEDEECDEAIKMVKSWEGKEFDEGVYRGDIEGEYACGDELDDLVDNLGKKK